MQLITTMAKVSIILDQRKADKQGRFPIKLRISAQSSNTSISTNVFVSPRDYIGEADHAVARTCANAKQINRDICKLHYMYLSAIMELERSGRLLTMSASDIRDYVNSSKEFVSERTFTDTLLDYRNTCRAEKTQQAYDYTMQMMERYAGKKKFLFEEVNFMFLTGFERWMEDNGIGMSSRSIVFRNMRTVYNYAINNDWEDMKSYPFRKFKIKQGKKEKVYLPEEKMRELLTLDLSGENMQGIALARDFFILSFLLCGINPIDLYNLPKQSKQISFIRQKIKFHEPKPIHIGIQPEAAYLINEYSGNEHLINLAEKYYSFDSCYTFMKHRMKKLGDMIGCKDMTFYWARYSWATYASKIDVSDSTISKALGHADATLADKKYIEFDWSKVDRANRRVIDYVFYGKKE